MESIGGILWASNGRACCIKLGKHTTRLSYDVYSYFEGKITKHFALHCHTLGGRSWFVVNHNVIILTVAPH